MRPFVGIVVLGMLLLPAGIRAAETSDECKATCASDKTAMEAVCPPASEENEQERAQCLSQIKDEYAACLESCANMAAEDAQQSETSPAAPQPAPADSGTGN